MIGPASPRDTWATRMDDPKAAIRKTEDAEPPLRERQSAIARSRAARSLREARFLFVCSLVLVAAIGFLVVSDLLWDRARTPNISVLIVVGVAVALTWRRYFRARQVVRQETKA